MHLWERSRESLLRMKNKVKASKAYMNDLQIRVSATAEEVTAILLDASTTCSQYARLQGYVRDLRTAQDDKREALQSDVIMSHAATSTAFRVSNKEAVRVMKVKKHVFRLKERMQVQREQRVRLLMMEGVLQIAAFKLKRKFDRLFATFQTDNIDLIISRCGDILIRETLHTAEAEDRLQQNAKLMDTLKDLIGTMLELQGCTDAKGELRDLNEEEYRLLGKYGSKIRSIREMTTRITTTLGSFLLKFKALDSFSQLGVYPALPCSLPSLFLSFEKIVLTSIDIRATHSPPKLKPMVVAMRHLLKGMLEPSQSKGFPRARVSKPYISLISKPVASSEDLLNARIRALCHEDDEDCLVLSLDNEELATAAEDMKAYKLKKSRTEETVLKPTSGDLKPDKLKPLEKNLSMKLSLRDVDKRLDELAKIRKKVVIPGKSEASEVILSLKKSTQKLIRPARVPPLIATPTFAPRGKSEMSPHTLPTTERGKRTAAKAERYPLSPAVSSRSTVGDISSPRGDHVDRLLRLTGLEKKE